MILKIQFTRLFLKLTYFRAHVTQRPFGRVAPWVWGGSLGEEGERRTHVTAVWSLVTASGISTPKDRDLPRF